MKILQYTGIQGRRDLPTRKTTDNKTQGGKCLIVAGSRGMWGAAILSATAAARCGAGYVYVVGEEKGFPVSKTPDFLYSDSLVALKDVHFSARALGPGMKSSKKILSLLKRWKSQDVQNVVLDASALNALAQSPMSLPSSWILTPHEGEMARLIGISSRKIRENREDAVLRTQRQYGCAVLLKGSGTLICDGVRIFKMTGGNSALAKAGTGDVLTGMIVAFLSQGLETPKAACLAAHIHGAIADLWVQSGKDHLSLMASDILNMLPTTISQLRKSKRK